MTSNLTIRDLQEILEYYETAETVEEQEVAVQDIAANYEIQRDESLEICQAISGYRGRLEELLDDLKNPESLCYVNETKLAWHQRQKQFVSESLNERQIREGKLLFLPNPNWGDAYIYQELGIPEQNWIATENGSEEERKRFLENGSILGVPTENMHQKDILNVAKNSNERLSVVSLDMLGGMCPKYMEILRNLLLKEDGSVIMINVQGKREISIIQQAVRSSASREKKHQTPDQSVWDYMRSTIIDVTTPNDELELKDARDLGMLTTVVQAIGMDRMENWLFPDRMKNLRDVFKLKEQTTRKVSEAVNIFYNFYNEIPKFLSQFETVIFNRFKKFRLHNLTSNLFNNLMDILFGRFQVIGAKKYHYQSESGNKTTPFNSEFVYGTTPLSEYNRHWRVADFFLTGMERYIGKAHIYARMVDKRGLEVDLETLPPSKIRSCKIQIFADNKFLNECSMGQIIDCSNLHEGKNRLSLTHMEEMERETIKPTNS